MGETFYITEPIDGQSEHIKRAFPYRDRLGRQIGACVTLWQADVTETGKGYGYGRSHRPGLELGRLYVMHVSATRAGKRYGASQVERYFKTEKQRTAAVEKYFADAEKRARKISDLDQLASDEASEAAGLRMMGAL